MCRRNGAMAASVPLVGVGIVEGAESLEVCVFDTGTARHFSCSNCGIRTRHRRRADPGPYGYNVGCLEGVNPCEPDGVPTKDGVDHAADRDE
jgi:hypothetical protein